MYAKMYLGIPYR